MPKTRHQKVDWVEVISGYSQALESKAKIYNTDLLNFGTFQTTAQKFQSLLIFLGITLKLWFKAVQSKEPVLF